MAHHDTPKKTAARDKISLLIPAYNEEAVLEKLYRRLSRLAGEKDMAGYDFEFLFVNDGSRDRTLDILQEYAEIDTRVAIVNLSRNYGKEIAMIAGFDHVTGDACVIIDADLQDPPELIPEMIKYWKEGYDDVYARRESRTGETLLKKLTSKLFYRTLQSVAQIPIQQDTGDFRLLSRRCVDALRAFRESQRYTKGFFSWIGYRKKEVTYVRDARAAGESKWNYLKLLDLAIEGIVSFTVAPLRFATYLGGIVALFTFLYLIYIVVRTIVNGTDLAGYPSTIAIILFLGGAQLLSLGIIGEYVGRIFNETKNRPLYFVDFYRHGDSMTTSPLNGEAGVQDGRHE